MSTREVPLVIVGCSGHGREVHDVLDAINASRPTWDLLGYVDDNPSEENNSLVLQRGSRILGGTEWLQSARPEVHYVLGIGSPAVRAKFALRFLDRPSPVLLHPCSSVGFDVSLGAGTVLFAGAHLTTHIRLGRHTHVNRGSTIGHDVSIDDCVTINPLAAVSGNVTIGKEVLLGTHSCVLQGVHIGNSVTVGAAALVTRDVPNSVVVVGVPAVAKRDPE